MKPLELVKEYFPGATDDEARDVLWCCTGWPHWFDVKEGQSVEDVLRGQLRDISEKSGQCPFAACVISDHEMDAAMLRGREEQAERVRLAAYFNWERDTGGAPVSEEQARQYWLAAEAAT